MAILNTGRETRLLACTHTHTRTRTHADTKLTLKAHLLKWIHIHMATLKLPPCEWLRNTSLLGSLDFPDGFFSLYI